MGRSLCPCLYAGVFRRGEGGEEQRGGPLGSPAGGVVIVFLQAVSQGTGRGRPQGPPHIRSTALAPTESGAHILG